MVTVMISAAPRYASLGPRWDFTIRGGCRPSTVQSLLPTGQIGPGAHSSLAMLMLASPHLPSSVSPAGFPEAQASAIDPLASSHLDEAERGGPGTLLGKG